MLKRPFKIRPKHLDLKFIIGPLATTIFMTSCSENSTSEADRPVTATRYAHECAQLSTGASPITVKNNCDFNIIFRELPNETPITIIVEMEEQYNPQNSIFNYGVCRAPYSPAPLENNQYDCR